MFNSLQDIPGVRPLAYCPFTGKFFRKFKTHWKETCLAKNKDGYLNIKVGGSCVSGHILAMSLMGVDTQGLTIDHINHRRDDNRFINLRVLSHKNNCINRESLQVRMLPSGKYRARCGNVHLGVFEDELLARGAVLWYRRGELMNA